MAISVADLAKYYADNPPPKNDSVADLEAGLEALSRPGYRSPFRFDSSLRFGSFGTSGHGKLGTRASIAEALKPPDVHSITTLYPLARGIGSGTRGAPNLSELFAQGRGPSPTPLWKQLAERSLPSPGLIGSGKFLYDGGNAGLQALEALRPQLEKFGLFMQSTALGLKSLEENLQRWMDTAGQARPVPSHPLEVAAYEALRALMKGRMEEVNRFLHDWLRISEPDTEVHEALIYVLNRNFERQLSELDNPAGWLRRAVLQERAGIIAQRDQVDTYSQRLAEELAAEEDAYHEPGKTFYLPPSTTYVSASADNPDPFIRSKNTGLRPPSTEDPGLLVPNKHGSWRQALEELANSGRRPTQERARLTLGYRQELEDREVAFSRKALLRRIGGTDAERALKEAARTRHKQILEESA